MNQKEKAILNDLMRFRCMTRDDIAELHFNHVKHPVTQANMVLKRMRRDGLIACSNERRMYIYFPIPGIKKDSAKINHFLAIVGFYKQLMKYEAPKLFVVEPKYGKGQPEPDVFMIWQRAPIFVEIQRSVYSDKVMKDKINRYELYHAEEQWKLEAWQNADRKVFPRLWIITGNKYRIQPSFKAIQTKDVDEFMEMVKPNAKI